MENPTKHSALSLTGTVIVVIAVLWLALWGLCIAFWIMTGLQEVRDAHGLHVLGWFVLLIGGPGILVGGIAPMIGRAMEWAGERRPRR